jgi:predicted nucleic acid-binding protein
LDFTRRLVNAYWMDVERIAVDDRLVELAGDLAETHALRAYDAVHLASALIVADDDLVLVAADRDLLRAAGAEALGTVSLVDGP